MCLACTSKFTAVRREQDQLRIDRRDCARNHVGQLRIAHGHVVKRSMRFDVVRSHIKCGGDRLKNSELISHGVEYFFVAYLLFLASKIFAVEKTWMRSNSDPVLLRRTNCGVHCVGIAGVKTSCDIRRANELEQLSIVSRAFAKIGVEIDLQLHDVCKLRPMRKSSNCCSRSPKSRCPSVSETSEKRT